jgi:ribosomal protein S18 acetylase RimI-like enzyme
LIVELAWDSKIFERKIGRLITVPAERKLKKLLSQAREEGYAYLTCRIGTGRIVEMQRLEAHGFYTTDIGIVWEKSPEGFSPGEVNALRRAGKKDALAIKSIANGLFLDSRFYHDPFFSREDAEKVYRGWIDNALRDNLQKTFLLENSGFIICRKLRENNGDIALIGVVSQNRRKGIGRALISKAFEWFHKEGVTVVTVRTQANNISAMNFYARMGFRVKYIDTTMGLILRK